LINCYFVNNNSGGLLNIGGSPTVTGCTFSGNSAQSGGAIFNDAFGNPTITNCIFIENYASGFGGIHPGGGAIFNDLGNPIIASCTFHGNSTGEQGGAIYSGPSLIIEGCIFSGNSADRGGAIRLQGGLINNCVFYGNAADDGFRNGGGIYMPGGSSATVSNCTFFMNSAEQGGAIWNASENTTVYNSVFWLNSPDQIYSASDMTVSFSDIQSGWAGLGSGNINAYPRFVSVEDPLDLRLLPESPCIDRGNNSAVPKGHDTDLDGNPRIVDGDGDDEIVVDMGAYEFQVELPCPADFNGDGIVGPFDLATLLGAWGVHPESPADLNGDGVVDPIDLATLLGAWGPCE